MLGMTQFGFWAGFITAVIFGTVGYVLGGFLPLPEPYTLDQTRVIYLLFGVLLAILLFARLTRWVITTTTTLTRQLILGVSSEVINQLSHLTSTGLHLPRANALDERINNPIILDTSALIDGRVLDVAKSGFLSGIVLLPDFVLREVQQVSDSSDPIKRARGRRGFEIVEQLKKIDGIKLQVWDEDNLNGRSILNGKTVDDKLIKLGKSFKGRILTVDYNLNRVASLSNVKVMNLNELGNALKNLPVPGESLEIKVVHLGKDNTQGVGYLTDGTMVVIKDGAGELGKTVKVDVSKILQASAGRMIFTQRSK
jgi:uncharacterized protein YacL